MDSLLKKVVDAFRRKRWLYRSSVTGRYVSKAFAEANPSTTYRVRAA
ncbi:hypothetical protein [Sphingomonas sp. LHG3406-1]|nr:hypothetical protein [Sphingomonas sp. LHG3406-1]